MSNPNNCATCRHKADPDGGWCYMFKAEPAGRCYQHTALQQYSMADVQRLMERMLPSSRPQNDSSTKE
jgi:hypothetical protein